MRTKGSREPPSSVPELSNASHFSALFTSLVRRVRSQCASKQIRISVQDAEDIAAETICQVITYFDDTPYLALPEKERRLVLMKYVAKTLGSSMWRHFKKQAHTVDLGQTVDDQAVTLPVDGSNSEDNMSSEPKVSAVRTTLAMLTESDRKLLERYHLDGMSIPELQKVFRLKTPSAVKMRIHRAQKRFSDHWRQHAV